LQDPNKAHGIVFLENRAKKLVLNKSNKNDVINIIGQPQIKDDINDDSWIYLERVLTKGKYHRLGKHLLKENNVLVLNFDKYGILKDKTILNKEDIKKLKFTKNTTKNEITTKSFVQSFLESVKQRMYGNR
jgi:outer membrane protein assembly factor BamE (lipoprotein component of BamABCDE complex)